MPRRRLTGSYWKFYLLSLFEKSLCCFSIEAGAGDIIAWQWMKVLFLQHLHQHWLFPVFLIIAILTGVRWYFDIFDISFWGMKPVSHSLIRSINLLLDFVLRLSSECFQQLLKDSVRKGPIFAFMFYYCHLEILRAFWTSHWHPTLTHQFHFTLTRPHKSYFQARGLCRVCFHPIFRTCSMHKKYFVNEFCSDKRWSPFINAWNIKCLTPNIKSGCSMFSWQLTT